MEGVSGRNLASSLWPGRVSVCVPTLTPDTPWGGPTGGAKEPRDDRVSVKESERCFFFLFSWYDFQPDT